MQSDAEAPGAGEQSDASEHDSAGRALIDPPSARTGSSSSSSAVRRVSKTVAFAPLPTPGDLEDGSKTPALRHSRLSPERAGGSLRRLSDPASAASVNSISFKLPSRRGQTVMKQQVTASHTPYEIRNLGLVLAFCAIVLLWEAVDHAVQKIWEKLEHRLIAYLVMAGFAKLCVWALVIWLRRLQRQEKSTIEVSYLYALSTILLAAGAWGALATLVHIVVPKKYLTFFWACSGVFFFTVTVLYGLYTKHNVLLDIGGCTAMMGLNDSDDEDDPDRMSSDSFTPKTTLSEAVTPAAVRISQLRSQKEELEAKLFGQEEGKQMEVNQLLQDASRMKPADRDRLVEGLQNLQFRNPPAADSETTAVVATQVNIPVYGAV
mmetsp:Transcript_30602/g.55813  ORF Transcript_30602/g.55813 Transcript_30602/m.55813 type:complete len:377 (+) Transcript_30602:86-1216(+)